MLSQAITAVGAIAVLWMGPSSVASTVPFDQWHPLQGDRFVVDTTQNIGYLIRSDNSAYLSFPVVTGQKRIVYYIGRTYDATTPNRHWVVKQRDIKGDRVTFGPTGRFLRLFRNGQESTPYGIHEHRSEERMFNEESRYQSMGCIIVRSAILDIIEATYSLNGNQLDVTTQAGFDVATLAPGSL